MKYNRLLFLLLLFLPLLRNISVIGQDLLLPENFPEFTLTENNDPDEGYIFLTTRATLVKKPASLVITDNYGTPVFYRHLPDASGGLSVNKNGLLSYYSTPGGVSKFFMLDSAYNVIDSVSMEIYQMDNHDFLALENGHFIIFGLDKRVVDLTSYGGISDATASGCVVQELDENKNVVFEWNSWDYYNIEDTYKDLTSSTVDLVHPNSLDLDYDGNILLLARSMNEVTKIDRNTGEIIWRLGGKNNQFDFADTLDVFSLPHDFQYLGDGHYTVFDNGSDRDPAYSRGVEYIIDQENKTIEMIWEYDAGKEVYGPSGGATRRLPSGNTLIGYGGRASQPAAIEVHPDGSKALQLDFEGDMSSGRTLKFPWQTTLFEPNRYEINFGEWDGYTTAVYLLSVKNNADRELTLTGYSTRTEAFTVAESFPISIPADGNTILTINYFPNTINYGYVKDVMTIDSDINSDTLIQRVSQQIKLEGTIIDYDSPSALIALDGAVQVALDTIIYINFNEPVEMAENGQFTFTNIDDLITLKLGGQDGLEVGFDAVINTDKTKITIIPDTSLKHSSSYFVEISGDYYDHAGNKGSVVTGSFETIDLTAPQASITPSDGTMNVPVLQTLYIDFNEEVRNESGLLLSPAALDTLIILRKYSAEGEDVPFNASMNSENTRISITPGEQFADTTKYYLELLPGLEDIYQNMAEGAISVFTTELSVGIKDSKTKMVKLYPNPGHGIYHLDFTEAGEYSLKVIDIYGRKIMEESKYFSVSDKIDIHNLSVGQYILTVSSLESGSRYVILLIKN